MLASFIVVATSAFVCEKEDTLNFALNLPNKHQNLEVKGMKEMASKTIVHNPKPINFYLFLII
jgi:hypothetical protein